MNQCIILGSGGSNGVPQIGCQCRVCLSEEQKNKRTRASILLRSAGGVQILIDSSPDLRQQALTNNLTQVDAVLYTHAHSDHIAGIDDIKTLSKGKVVPAYADAQTAARLSKAHEYIFEQGPNKIYKPFMRLETIQPYQKWQIGDITVQAFQQMHGNVPSLGFRFGDLVYSTDINHIPEESYPYLQNVDIWILDFLRYYWSPSHLYLDTFLDFIAKVKPKRVILTHMAHDVDFYECQKILPASVQPAYDGMVLNF